MTAELYTVRLYGKMGTLFGRRHQFYLDSGTVAEAFAALQSQIKGLTKYLMDAKDRGVAFTIFSGDRNIGEKELHMPKPASREIRVAPIPMGAKKAGVVQLVVGAVVVIASVVYGYWTGDWGNAYKGVYMGAAMMLGGVVQMLTPVPKGLHSADSPANTPSYSFNGPINTQAQGNPVPLFYGGAMPVGSCVISAGIDTKDTSTSHWAGGPGTGHMGGGGGCVTANSFVWRVQADGTMEAARAGEVRVGDLLLGAHPDTLAPMVAEVTYSESVEQPCVVIELPNNIRLSCSRSAPIPTGRGLVNAPDVEGELIACRVGMDEGWDPAVEVRDIGVRFVQHISINDGCFWAGEIPDKMILHHNKMATVFTA